MAQSNLDKVNGPKSSKGKNNDLDEPIPEGAIKKLMESMNITREDAIQRIEDGREKMTTTIPISAKKTPLPKKPETVVDVPEESKEEVVNLEQGNISDEEMDMIVAGNSDATLAVQRAKFEFLKPVMSIEQAKIRRKYMSTVISDVLEKGKHYGNPINQKTGKPAWGSDKLLKPGAEILASMFGLEPKFIPLVEVENHEKYIYRYKIKCELVSIKTGIVVGSAIAAASSQESFIYGNGAELWNNTLQRAQKRALCKAVEFVTGVDEFFTDPKKYAP